MNAKTQNQLPAVANDTNQLAESLIRDLASDEIAVVAGGSSVEYGEYIETTSSPNR